MYDLTLRFVFGKELVEVMANEKTPRGKNYSPIEDVALSRAWMRISGDASVGVYQTADRFWSRIKDGFHDDEDIASLLVSDQLELRSSESLQGRFGVITKCVGKFLMFMERAEQSGQSGRSAKDAYISALTMYQMSRKTKKPFEILQDEIHRAFVACPLHPNLTGSIPSRSLPLTCLLASSVLRRLRPLWCKWRMGTQTTGVDCPTLFRHVLEEYDNE